MEVIQWIRFIFGAIFLLSGVAVFIIEMVGAFKFKFVLNRMHAAAMGDTLGIAFSMLGLIIMNGINLTSVKLFLVVCFLWFSSPVASHMIAELTVTINQDNPEKFFEEKPLKELESELTEREEKDGTV